MTKKHQIITSTNIIRNAIARLVLSGLGIVIILASIIACVSTISSTDNVILDTAYEEGELENGMQYFIYPTDAEPDKIMLQVTINAGSLYEETHELGISHFLEHLAFNSSEKYTREEFSDLEQSLGIGMGSHSNAFTSHEMVSYHIALQELSDNRIEQLFDIMSQRTLHITFDPEEIERERGVVLSEKLLSDTDPSYHQYMLVHNTILQGSSYPERLPIGTEERIKHVSPEEIEALYRKWYRPSRMAVMVIGDITSEEIKPYLDSYFGSVPEPANVATPPNIITSIPTKSNRTYQGYYDPSIIQNRVEIYHSMVEEHSNSLQFYARQFVHDGVAMFVSDQFSEYVLNKNPATVLNSIDFYKSMYTPPNIYVAGTFIDIQEHALQEGLEEAQAFLDNLALQLRTPEALDQIQTNIDYAIDDILQDNYESLDYIGYVLSDYFIYRNKPVDDYKTLKKYGNAIVNSISNEDLVNLFESSFYSEENSHVFLFVGDANKKYIINDTISEDLAIDLLFEQHASQATFYQQQNNEALDIDAILQASLDTLQNRNAKSSRKKPTIIEEQKDERTNIITWKLANGFTVLFNQVESLDSSDTQIVVSSHSKLIEHYYSNKFPSASDIMSGAFYQASIDGYLLSTLLDEINSDGMYSPMGIEVSTNTKHIEEVFKSVHLIYTNLQISEDNFTRAKSQELEYYKEALNGPFAYTYFTILNHITSNSVFFRDRLEEDYVQSNTYNEIMEYQQAWQQSDDTIFMITADSSPRKIKRLVEKWLAPLATTNAGSYNLDDEVYEVVATDGVLNVTRQDSEAMHVVIRAAGAIFPPSKTTATQYSIVANIASQYLHSYIEERIREELGEAYFVQAFVDYILYPVPYIFFLVGFPTDPEKSTVLAQELDDLLDTILPIDEAILNNSKSIAISQAHEDFASEAVLVGHQHFVMHTTRGEQFFTNAEELIEAIELVDKRAIETLLQEVLALPKIAVISRPSASVTKEAEE